MKPLNVHIVTICYNLPMCIEPLLASLRCQGTLHVHLFQHSPFPEMLRARDEAVEKFKYGMNNGSVSITVYDYRENRGLATSWNEGMVEAQREGADAVLIVNDDIVFAPGDVDRLAEATAECNDSRSIVVCRANHSQHGPDHAIGYSCFGWCKQAWREVGCFDENFLRIYHEDQDYGYRCRLAGLNEHGVILGLMHGGSRHLYDNRALHVDEIRRCNGIVQPTNGAYYRRKWGGDSGSERFTYPFNDGQFSHHISPAVRHDPYPDYGRTSAEKALNTI